MIPDSDLSEILSAYSRASSRIFFLDYDGTLVPFTPLPGQTTLDPDTRILLQKLVAESRNRIYIVSGRNRAYLEREFSGMQVGLVAEHGFARREPGGDWILPGRIHDAWKQPVSEFLSRFSAQFPGSLVEVKESSLAFHYRNSNPDLSARIRADLQQELTRFTEQYPGLQRLEGSHVTEIKPVRFQKGSAARQLMAEGCYDFIVAAGDDLTDESLFTSLPPEAFTIKIGNSESNARFRIPDPISFRVFLETLSRVSQ